MPVHKITGIIMHSIKLLIYSSTISMEKHDADNLSKNKSHACAYMCECDYIFTYSYLFKIMMDNQIDLTTNYKIDKTKLTR